jgi:hypothetical protein
VPVGLLGHARAGHAAPALAAILAHGNDAPDAAAAETALIGLAADGEARRVGIGDGALWLAAG